MLPELDTLIRELRLHIQLILNDKFMGMYLGGSIANACFDIEKSDIDCYILITTTLSKRELALIEEMHRSFYNHQQISYTKKIEASYLALTHLNQFSPTNTRPYFNEGSFYLAPYGSNFIIELKLLRDKGITVLGPDIKPLIRSISSEELKDAIKENLNEYWQMTLKDRTKYSRSDYQVFAILTMCRTLYSLETGEITSKMEAAQWARDKFKGIYKTLIEQAINWKPGIELKLIDETQTFVKHLLQLRFD